jgi:hypothetical protein
MTFASVFHPRIASPVKAKIGKMGIENLVGDEPFYNPAANYVSFHIFY